MSLIVAVLSRGDKTVYPGHLKTDELDNLFQGILLSYLLVLSG